jgi:cytoskeletal protein CcmA (bactofilin family)
MFGAKNKPQNRIDSLIGTGTTVEGDVNFVGGLRIDGKVKGNVVAFDDKPGMLVVSEHAEVEGEIRVHHVVINGAVIGPIYAAESLELQPKANITGDVHYKSLEMQLGAVVQGRLMFEAEGRSDKVVKFKPTAVES